MLKKNFKQCLLKEKVKRKSLLFIRLLKSDAMFEELIILKQKTPADIVHVVYFRRKGLFVL